MSEAVSHVAVLNSKLIGLRAQGKEMGSTLADFPADPLQWVHDVFPHMDGMAPHHVEMWKWAWGVRPGIRPRPAVFILARGHGKSTNLESIVCALAARRVVNYAWYISGTQEQADYHVADIAVKLHGEIFREAYPATARRAVNLYGQSMGWTRQRLTTASSFTVDALGLNVAARGKKIEDRRPDLIIFDDLDSRYDSPEVTRKRLGALVGSLLGAKAAGAAIIGAQNLIHERSIFSLLARRCRPQDLGMAPGEGEFLIDRKVVGPIPAVEGLAYERRDVMMEGEMVSKYFITAGVATWPQGKSLQACEEDINDFGPSVFEQECQHNVKPPAGGIFSGIDFERLRVNLNEVPKIVTSILCVDPAVTNTDGSDCYAISVGALGVDGRVYCMYDWESVPGVPLHPEEDEKARAAGDETKLTSPEAVLVKAILYCLAQRVPNLMVETDQGGQVWYSAFTAAMAFLRKKGQIQNWHRIPKFLSDKAGYTRQSKMERWQVMATAYEQDGLRHVIGTHDVLERALWRVPTTKPYDLADAAYWKWRKLNLISRGHARSPGWQSFG